MHTWALHLEQRPDKVSKDINEPFDAGCYFPSLQPVYDQDIQCHCRALSI